MRSCKANMSVGMHDVSRRLFLLLPRDSLYGFEYSTRAYLNAGPTNGLPLSDLMLLISRQALFSDAMHDTKWTNSSS